MSGKRDELYAIVSGVADTLVILTRKPNACVQVSAKLDGKRYTGVGFAKVRWPDKWNVDYGINLAKEKAIMHVVKQIMEEENGQ